MCTSGEALLGSLWRSEKNVTNQKKVSIRVLRLLTSPISRTECLGCDMSPSVVGVHLRHRGGVSSGQCLGIQERVSVRPRRARGCQYIEEVHVVLE